jgi:hypothetical protein
MHREARYLVVHLKERKKERKKKTTSKTEK